MVLEENGRMASKSPIPGDLVQLRKGVLLHVKIREWTVLGKNSGRVILINYTPKGHALEVVKEDDIDWGEYQKEKTRHDSFPSWKEASPKTVMRHLFGAGKERISFAGGTEIDRPPS